MESSTLSSVPGVAPTSSPAPDSPPQIAKQQLPLSIEAFDTLINGDVAKYMEKSRGMGGLVAEQVWRNVTDEDMELMLGYLGGSSIRFVRSRAEVPPHSYQVEEAGYFSPGLHVATQGLANTDGSRERYSGR